MSDLEQWRNQGASPPLAKSPRKFDPNYKLLNVFWTSPVSKGEGLKKLGNLILLNNFLF